MEFEGLNTRRAETGGYERRTAERFEARLEPAAKDFQRNAVADWLTSHHRPDERMRLLSLPDRYWTFENRMNNRPDTSFVGLQRDWRTLELSVPWMPVPGMPGYCEPQAKGQRAAYFSTRTAFGDVGGYRRGKNTVFHMWAGHMLNVENLPARNDRPGTTLRNSGFRRVTAAWLDFTGYLTDEVVAATAGIPVFLGSSLNVFPVVISFLACRDKFHDHEARVAHLLIGLQQSQPRRGRGFRFRFDRFEVHTGTNPFISVFGAYHTRKLPTIARAGSLTEGQSDLSGKDAP